ncbi:cilia- and flagella-associated protein 91 isoform X2 [Chelonus insularis]|uniref:cilia- and flagella-associated protein 91 isoform X2 n=1 Tax=Chelonus insularis TaxID=460826 RepID=UPI00158C11B6|nr:cilia- and flagella-associated protein 91 isoform X2 [Chelonus insularis]
MKKCFLNNKKYIPKSATSNPADTEPDKVINDTEKESANVTDKEKEEAAAVRIQAAFRGHQTRKSMKGAETTSQKGTRSEESDPSKAQLEEEFRADDVDLCNAATKIQASFRGHMSRKEQAITSAVKAAEDVIEDAASKIKEKVDDAASELQGIDLSDPDLHKAATKIQASFRGHKVRQEVTISGTENKN